MGGPEMAPQLVQARGLRPLGLPGQRSGRPGGAVAPLDPRRSGQPGGAVTPLDRALEAAARARVTLILGTSDTGKTSLTARLAGALAARGERVAVVDADVGQSEIGPPTTVGLGHVAGAVARLGDAEVIALEFVGDTSPVRYIRETADATGRLVRRALDAGFERVLVDTGGLVEGPLGLALKRAKVRAADPDLVLVLQRSDESEPIARALERDVRPRVVRLAPSPAVVRRSAARRREHRERALRDYLAHAATLTLPTARAPVRDRRGEALTDVAEGLLLGVLGVLGDADGLVRSGTVPTLSVSVRLHAMVIPPASARAQSPDDPPCGVCFDPPPRAATAMPVVRFEPASVTSCKGDSRHEARRLARRSRAPSEGLGSVPRSRAVEESHSRLRKAGGGRSRRVQGHDESRGGRREGHLRGQGQDHRAEATRVLQAGGGRQRWPRVRPRRDRHHAERP